MPRPNTAKPAATPRRAPSPRKGMRLHKIWLPDMDSPEFIAGARRQSLAAANSPDEKDLQAFIDSVSTLPDLPEYRW